MTPGAADLALNAASAWLGPRRWHVLMRRFGSPEGVLAAGPERISAALPALRPPQARALLDFCASFDADGEARALARPGVRALRHDAAGYPRRLSQLPDPPPWLFVEGRLPADDEAAVAVVGTRNPTEYGRRLARELAAGLARAGVWVVSGLARGIDAEAHAACIAAGGATLAVFGTGLDAVWPAEHGPLARAIVASGGGLASQFPMASPGIKLHFPMRNGVISALGMGVVVVEGARGSGALITADRALEQGREVFAVPGPADAPLSQGPLDLLEQGARLVRSCDDILEELALAPPRPRGRGAASAAAARRAAAPPDSAGADARRLWWRLAAGPLGLEEAGRACGLGAAALAAAVTELELVGALVQRPGPVLERADPGAAGGPQGRIHGG